MRTRFILIETSHPGNVGAAARALKVMGFDEMVLVAPRYANVLRKEETIQRASGANDVLDKTRIVDTLDEALDGVTHLCATAMTPRDFGPPTSAPRAHLGPLAGQHARVGPGERQHVGLVRRRAVCQLVLVHPAVEDEQQRGALGRRLERCQAARVFE